MEPISTFQAHDNYVFQLAFTQDGKTHISCGMDGLVKLWSVPDWQPLRTFEGHEKVSIHFRFPRTRKHSPRVRPIIQFDCGPFQMGNYCTRFKIARRLSLQWIFQQMVNLSPPGRTADALPSGQ